MGDANRVNLSYVKESVFGETPSGPPTLKNLRYVSESLHQETSTTRSNEIRSDRQTSDITRTNISAIGDVGFEWSYGSYDDLLAAVLFSGGWSVAPADTTASAVVAATGVMTVASAANIEVGMWIKTSGFADEGNNGVFKVTAINGTDLTVAPTTDLVDEAAAGATVQIGSQIVNGTTGSSYSFEREYTDLTNVFALLRGLVPQQFALTVNTEGLVTGSFNFMGKDEQGTSATVGDGANTEVNGNPVMNAVDNVLLFLEDTGAHDITEFSMNLNNNLRNRQVVGTLGPISIGAGSVAVSGTVNAYFEDNTQLNKYRNNQKTNLGMVFQDDDGNTLVVDLPRVKLSTGQAVAGGINTDVMQELSFEAYMHETEQVTIRIVRFPAA